MTDAFHRQVYTQLNLSSAASLHKQHKGGKATPEVTDAILFFCHFTAFNKIDEIFDINLQTEQDFLYDSMYYFRFYCVLPSLCDIRQQLLGEVGADGFALNSQAGVPLHFSQREV